MAKTDEGKEKLQKSMDELFSWEHKVVQRVECPGEYSEYLSSSRERRELLVNNLPRLTDEVVSSKILHLFCGDGRITEEYYLELLRRYGNRFRLFGLDCETSYSYAWRERQKEKNFPIRFCSPREEKLLIGSCDIVFADVRFITRIGGRWSNLGKQPSGGIANFFDVALALLKVGGCLILRAEEYPRSSREMGFPKEMDIPTWSDYMTISVYPAPLYRERFGLVLLDVESRLEPGHFMLNMQKRENQQPTTPGA
ncbi:MAG: hypothetical protein HGA67_01390 [Candidatus Yonathbacteria bacterium]|nr:hypothetical protein [Candidatus Yonathbacteria bacterium]